MSDHENLLLKLRQEASRYSPTQQKLGEFLLNDPARVLYLTITELARESETSEASVTRLCRTLGCKGYNEFKMALALDLVNVRLILEPGIAEMAALNATEEAILELRCCCERVEERIASGDMYIQDDIAFHTSVARCSGNKVVEQLIPIIDTAVMMFVNVTHQRLTKETVMTHRAIVDAISDRDPIGAKTAMMMHMTYNRNMILKLIREEKEKNHKE